MATLLAIVSGILEFGIATARMRVRNFPVSYLSFRGESRAVHVRLNTIDATPIRNSSEQLGCCERQVCGSNSLFESG